MQATDETVRLIWEELVDSDRMCRYYGYLSHRLNRLSELLAIGTIGAASGAFFALLYRFPDWVPSTAAAAAAIASLVLVVGRYQDKAARSADLGRQLARVAIEWQKLWSGVYQREDAELLAAWEALVRRQATILERAPVEVPLSRSLARRSEREADRYWSERYASA